jgi:hypothetical protein
VSPRRRPPSVQFRHPALGKRVCTTYKRTAALQLVLGDDSHHLDVKNLHRVFLAGFVTLIGYFGSRGAFLTSSLCGRRNGYYCSIPAGSSSIIDLPTTEMHILRPSNRAVKKQTCSDPASNSIEPC